MRINRCFFVTSLFALSFGISATAESQITTVSPRVQSAAGLPTATASFKPLETHTTLNGAFFRVIYTKVNVYESTSAYIETAFESEVGFTPGNQPTPNGFYSVQFTFTWSNGTVVRITRGGETLAECSLPLNNSYTVEKICESPVFEVTDGRFPVSIKAVSGGGTYLTKISISSYAPPTTLKIRD